MKEPSTHYKNKSVKNATPDWNIYNFERFPAIRWKLQNLQDLKDKNPDKHRELYEALKKKLNENKFILADFIN
jgi:hypothetical protein